MSDEKRVCLGVASGAFGVKGEVRIKSFTEPPGNIGLYGTLFTDPGGQILTIRALRPLKEGFAARIEGVEDRDAAEALRGKRLMVERSALPEEDEDEFYHVDLIGCRAESEDGEALGAVQAVHDFGAGPLLEVGENGKTRLFPFTKDAVPRIDIAGRLVVIATAALAEEDEDETKRGDDETR